MRQRMLRLAVTCALLAIAASAQAGGLEYTGAGAVAEGRGGAVAAAPNDPMALQFNPAALADLPGNQLLLSVNVGLFDACLQRPGTYAETGHFTGDTDSTFGDSNDWAGMRMPEMCNERPFAPGASLVYTHQLSSTLGFGVGVLTPTAAGHTQYGEEDGTVMANGRSLPSPVRYNLVEQNHLEIFPTVGIGWKPTPWLSVGLALQWGFAEITNRNFVVGNMNENPATDLYANIVVADLFVPGIIGSVQIRPMEGLDLMLGARWVDTIHASGTAEIDSGVFHTDPAQRVRSTIDGMVLHVPQASWLSAGVRWAMLRNGAPTAGEHAHRMDTEVFDVEINATYELNSVVEEFLLETPAGAMVNIGGTSTAPLPQQIHLPHNWKNQLVLRVGGDWNVLPGTLAVRAGAHFETSGIDPDYAQLDFLPGQRVGLHLGGTYRLGALDLSLAYSHIFQADVTAPLATASYNQISALDAGYPINAGTYTASFNVFSVSGNYHF